ncbi:MULTISPECIES: NAD(P)H-dependent flavin oxidoreductase [Rhizobium]|uniref:NAD(P)H-dependent flavin oxidoreductase n=1 Tax=Rhizobium TaxID=379 RepID=UPI00103A7A84|nr:MULTISPECIES: nitronate monooxygenase [Rhizobium]MBY5754738.1 nitronate monooxygenase [Rhizobium leguminosarum]NKM15850.1 nitronate monooxygenase [Rhizobium laguerreae]TBZ20962.1 nitronate monooxygenase [Rhizobium leguminosarum bv. viciae]
MIELLGTAHPIIQAPMAGISTPALAAAVSNAGALGSLGIGASSVAQARSTILQTQSLTDKPFNVNVFCNAPPRRDRNIEAAWISHFSALFEKFGAKAPESLNEIYQTFVVNDEAFQMLLEVRPAFVSFHFGIPEVEKIAAFREAGIKTLATATKLQEARTIEAAGIEGIIAQGIEAGGHRGVFDTRAEDDQLATLPLVRLLIRNSRLPVVAAGGIMDGHGTKAALDQGAVAAQLGTAFILCPESAADVGYRANLKSCRSGFTRLTSVVSGRPARGIVNQLIEHGEAGTGLSPADYPIAYDLAKQLHAAATRGGNNEFAAHWAGQGARLARELPAAQLVKILVEEFTATSAQASLSNHGRSV